MTKSKSMTNKPQALHVPISTRPHFWLQRAKLTATAHLRVSSVFRLPQHRLPLCWLAVVLTHVICVHKGQRGYYATVVVVPSQVAA